ncbi:MULTISPECIES: hypothetical protein [Plantibacter]|uniref:hypothetical protein n=1 Tax=Plantibacter TaxID=190323 RepID=UPI0010C1EC3D|nr:MULTISPECIES: hypothetical protein [Plantibacter]MBD8467281.1 hypothetical protein [Plantibacter sp. CFBP 8798]
MHSLIPRWLRLLLWIVGAVNAHLAIVNLISGNGTTAVLFGIAGDVCLVLAVALPRNKAGSTSSAAAGTGSEA